MNKKILLSALSIVTALVMAGGATYAFFSDVGTSTGNVFASGTLDLKLGNGVTAASDNVTTTLTGTDMAPGGTPVTATLNLKNTGTVPGHHVDFKAHSVITDASPTEDAGTMAKHLKLTTLTYGGVDILPLVTDTNLNGIKDLDDLESGGDGINIGSLTDLNIDHPLVIAVQLDGTSTDNTYQGDSVNTTFTATLDQDVSQ